MSKRALITGSGGLIGSACVGLLADRGWQVIGVDNNMREVFFGPQGSTTGVVKPYSADSKVTAILTDIRDRRGSGPDGGGEAGLHHPQRRPTLP